MERDDEARQKAEKAYEYGFFAANMVLYIGPLALVFGLPEVFELNHWVGFAAGAGVVFGSIALTSWLPPRFGEMLAEWQIRRLAKRQKD